MLRLAVVHLVVGLPGVVTHVRYFVDSYWVKRHAVLVVQLRVTQTFAPQLQRLLADVAACIRLLVHQSPL